MPLQAPKKQVAGGYLLVMNPPAVSPPLKWIATGGATTGAAVTEQWVTWADQQRKQLLGELLSHGNWFARPPRHDVLDPLLSPWAGKSMKGELQFFCALPPSPGGPGTGALSLTGLTMTATSISPNWRIENFTPDPEDDKISLFGGDDDEGEEGTREIHFEDIEAVSPAMPPTQIRNREWDAKKFMAKERVREARLKAQVAEHIARKEEVRFLSVYGDLDDNESTFSEYDLSEEGASGDEHGSTASESPSNP